MTTGRRFLMYCDNVTVSNALKEQMTSLPETKLFEVTDSKNDLLSKAKEDFFDAIIVDNNSVFCDELRKKGYQRPIILLSSNDDEQNEQNTNITDFLSKPFRFNSFVSRLYQAINNNESSDNKGFVIGHFTFSPKNKTITSNLDFAIQQLTEKEAEILTYLYRAGGKIVDKDTLLKEVWGYNADLTTHTLETHIYRLRQKIDTDTEKPLIVCWDGGYRIGDDYL